MDIQDVGEHTNLHGVTKAKEIANLKRNVANLKPDIIKLKKDVVEQKGMNGEIRAWPKPRGWR